MISKLLTSATLLLGAVCAEPTPTVTEAPAATTHPWYVRAVSDQIVNYCFFGGLMGGGGGGDSNPQPAAPTVISFSSAITETYTTGVATTLYTTIPGSTITIYGDDGSYSTSEVAHTYTTVFTPTTAVTDVTGTFTLSTITPSAPATGLKAELVNLENYAHALADAIVAPQQMTKVISSAYEAIFRNGYVHADEAVKLVSQASQGLGALRTDPAYAKQSARLVAQPTPLNYKKVAHAVASSHKAGFDQLLAEPSGHQALHDIKELGKEFISIFGQQ